MGLAPQLAHFAIAALGTQITYERTAVAVDQFDDRQTNTQLLRRSIAPVSSSTRRRIRHSSSSRPASSAASVSTSSTPIISRKITSSLRSDSLTFGVSPICPSFNFCRSRRRILQVHELRLLKIGQVRNQTLVITHFVPRKLSRAPKPFRDMALMTHRARARSS